MKVALTDLSVRAIKAPACGQKTNWDKNSPIGVRASVGGSKSFVVMIGSGQRKVIGRVGILSLAEARGEAKRILAEKTLGLTKKPSAINFETAVPLFLEDNYKNARGKRTKSEAKRLLEKHFVPPFRKRPLSDITDGDISVELAKLSKTPSAQLHAYRAIKVMMRWCTRPPRRYIQHSPPGRLRATQQGQEAKPDSYRRRAGEGLECRDRAAGPHGTAPHPLGH